MARVSVEVPAELVRTVRETVLLLYQATAESLHQALKGEAAVGEAHSHRLRLDELDDLVESLTAAEGGVGLTASRDLLHDMLYGALIDSGERLADVSTRCWRGELPPERIQEAAEEVLALDALLRELDELSP